jgi:lipopolysaccharide biosynthesis glycosyltransferase
MDSVYIGYDTRMPAAYMVANKSLAAHAKRRLDVNPILLPHLRSIGLYDRPTRFKDGVMWDDISGAPMSTEFAISRFFVPYLARYRGWSIFCDSDFMFFDDIAKVFDMADSKYAVMCVKHDYQPAETVKMDGQKQMNYAKKNWSSFMLFNNAHPSNAKLCPKMLNSLPGRDLHGFCWLHDSEIGELPASWNWLEGHSTGKEISAIHYTRGTPDMVGYEHTPFADIWRSYAGELCISES